MMRRQTLTFRWDLIVHSKMTPMKKRALSFFLLLPSLIMAQSNNTVTENFLQSFADAFNAHDVKAIMSHMTADCVFEASAGPDADGEKFTGQEQVKKAFENVFASFPDAHWGNPRHFVLGDRGFTEWLFTGTKTDGTRVEVTGCDLFTFKDGKIAIKNSYRKNRISIK
jgi:ketosteroid isomerase-like protein